MKINLLNGIPVVNKEPKPKYPYSMGRHISRIVKKRRIGAYNRALKDWEANCIPVENVQSSWGKPKLKIGEAFYDIPKPGQHVETEQREGKTFVTKIK